MRSSLDIVVCFLSTILGLHLGQSGIFFINVAYLIFHSCSQILHCNLIGELVFMKDTKDKSEGDKYFCISAIFFALFSARFPSVQFEEPGVPIWVSTKEIWKIIFLILCLVFQEGK